MCIRMIIDDHPMNTCTPDGDCIENVDNIQIRRHKSTFAVDGR